MDLIIPKALKTVFLITVTASIFEQWRSFGGTGGAIPPPPPNQNFEAKVLNFAVLSFGPRILSFSFKF